MKPENELFFSRNMVKVKYIYCNRGYNEHKSTKVIK